MEWYTFSPPVWQKSVSLAKPAKIFGWVTISSRATNAELPGFSHAVALAWARERGGWLHLWNNCPRVLLQVCLLVMCFNTDIHFSSSSCAFPSQKAALHQRWFDMDWIHGARSWFFFIFACLLSFLTMDFEKCHTSYWWFMSACCLSIALLIPMRQSVVMVCIETWLSSRELRHQLNPSISMAFDDFTSLTCTALNSTTFAESLSIRV